MKEKLSGALGFFGMILFYIISTILTFAPLFFIPIPLWAQFLIVLAVLSIPVLGDIVQFVTWVVGFVFVLQQPIDIWSILFFIVAAIYIFTTVLPTILSLISPRE